VFGSALAFEALVEGNGMAVITAKVVKILDLVKTNDPVLTCESFLQGVKLGAFLGELGATNTIHGLTCWEETLIVVVRHLVPVE